MRNPLIGYFWMTNPLNASTEKDNYPLPNINFLFTRMEESKYFTMTDTMKGILADENDTRTHGIDCIYHAFQIIPVESDANGYTRSTRSMATCNEQGV
ncbi:hypothetical protein BDF14DRAFT_1166577 [Spinellus fusiger]|nr:hypothetical protein BDF14DRAFT_1166577 [Spinellus fusiger]